MKKKLELPLILSVCVIVILGSVNTTRALETIQVEPGLGTLNDAIEAYGSDTTIFELQRGPEAYYILSGTIEYEGFHLTIVAEEGEGDRPKIVPTVLSGPESFRCFRPKSDLTLKGIYATDVAQDGVMYSKNIVRAQAESIRVVIDDCHLDGDYQSHIRFDAHQQRVFITNSLLSWSVENGRSLDRRGNKVDTLVVENCTFYNLISKVMREGGSGYIKYFKFNHNTVYNVGSEFMEFGEIATLIFTNNLIYDVGFLGLTSTDTDPNYILEQVDTLSSDDFEGVTQTIEFRNNNFYLDPAIVEAHTNLNPDSLEGYTVIEVPFIDSLSATLIDTSTIMHEALTFTNAPILDSTLNIIKVVWEKFDGDEDYASPFDNGGVGGYAEEGFGTCALDFSYPTTAESYTAADGGQPLGDLNWFGMEISIVEPVVEVPSAFRLLDNYPNPFNPATTIRYELPRASHVRLIVYDVLGHEIARLVDRHQGANNYSFVWNGRDANGRVVSSGVYFYQLKADDSIQTRKMIFLK